MGSNVLRFDFQEMARLAKEDPDGFAHKREALIRQLIDRASQTEHLTELQKALNQACYQIAAPSLQLGFQITDMMLQTTSIMAAHISTLNKLMQLPLSNDLSEKNHERTCM